MGRLNQKSLNMWIPDDIHMEIKQQSNSNSLSIKDYILKLHALQVSSNVLQAEEFQVNKQSDQRMEELVQRFDKILEKMEKKQKRKPRSDQVKKVEKVSVSPKSPIPPNIEQILTSQKANNPRFKENNYQETIQAIIKGNHLRRDIDNFRGSTFYNTKSKNSEKPLNKLVELGVLEVRYENEKIPNQKFYYITQFFL